MNKGDAVMAEPDEALLWAREQCATDCDERGFSHVAERYRRGAYDNLFEGDARAYRAGAAASAERIKALEARVAELEDMASRYLIQMSDMLTRLEERYPEDFVWLKDGDEPTDEARALLKEPDQ